MGIPDGSLLDLIDKVRSWITLGSSDPLCLSGDFEMPNLSKMCNDCGTKSEGTVLFHGCCCQSCGRWWCENCMSYPNETDERECKKKLCRACVGNVLGGKSYEKVYPRESPEPPSPSGIESVQSDNLASSLQAPDCRSSPHAMANRNMSSIRCYPCRAEEVEAECSGKQFLSPSSEYYQDTSDIDSGSVSARHDLFSCKSSGSSPCDSPCRNDFSPLGRFVQHGKELSPITGSFVQEPMAVLRKPNPRAMDLENHDVLHCQEHKSQQQTLDFENNGLIWYPPPPEDENDEAESNYFVYDDEDDAIGDSATEFSSNSSFSSHIPAREKLGESHKEPLKTVVHGHFRALVAELLRGEGLNPSNEGSGGDWLDIVTALAWQAANFVKPDTRAGGSMDPGDYVKIKCIASGRPNESILIKGIVCSKNIKHKRMTSQYKNPRLLLLGGALEYQRVTSQLASFNTLLQQENDHLRTIIAKIESLRPNVLLVEKSVSSYAQQYLLEKEISLVLNVKRSLLEQIARCTGALLCPSVDSISTARLGHCELFRTEKVMEQHEVGSQFNRKPSKTLMYFEGCPRRLGCTVLLRGSCREELKKVKDAVQYAAFAAYHLSLETSFLADEGASLPRMILKQPRIALTTTEMRMLDGGISSITHSPTKTSCQTVIDTAIHEDQLLAHTAEHEVSESLSEDFHPGQIFPSSSGTVSCIVDSQHSDALNKDLPNNLVIGSYLSNQLKGLQISSIPSSIEIPESHTQVLIGEEDNQLEETHDLLQNEKFDENDVSSEYFSAADSHHSILVSFSSHCVLKESVCERSRLLRIKFYGSFDKPLGRYLRDDLFDQTSTCRSCKEPVDAHALCYTHQNGNLTIIVRRLSSMKLPGEQDGKIWMWHRCLRCGKVDGVPPATRRVVMSDAAWGLSFGKFLELSFSNHATANRVASCGHSLQRDCLRFYGFGSMVAFFRYSPIDILTVCLPPSVLEFNSHHQHGWIRKEAAELMSKMQTMYTEISETLNSMEEKSSSIEQELSDAYDLQSCIMDLKDQLLKEKDEYDDALQPIFVENIQESQSTLDILELNRLRRALLIGSYAWDHQLCLLNSRLRKACAIKASDGDVSGHPELQHRPKTGLGPNEGPYDREDVLSDSEAITDNKDSGNTLSPASSLSERIDSAWLGTCKSLENAQPMPEAEGFSAVNSPLQRLARPIRVHSFDSVLRYQERIQKGLPPSSLYLSTLRSFHASGEYRNMVRDPVTNVMRTYTQMLPLEVKRLNLIVGTTPTYISSASHMADGARFLISQDCLNDIVIPVYDDDPASVISYALSSKEYGGWVADKGGGIDRNRQTSPAFMSWRSLGSVDVDFIHYTAYGSQDDKKSPHLTISFIDDSSATEGKVKFSVTCYFAKLFDSLRNKCCPSEVDFVRSLSRCQRWRAQGGKSNVYFAKSLDERFIIKQVIKTELESFEEFAPEYFKYLTDSLSSGSPTCLAKVLGIYQVSIKHLNGGKEMKMDLMVMENLFYRRGITRIYDLKGSARSRYNANTSGGNKVLLDMNLLETLRTEPIFLGSKAKRSLERAIWNDTSFLASVDVMDYSLLVGIDEERKELVLGIIDFMRQYTWDKHLETWVKASGILGGPKNASPTIISPKQYKKRFRKAMTTYFLTVPDQWSS
ncbi:PREDICTED: putative 1-phosphatidylinositol-3-phosphate 5-kinase FAB1C isoform X2 [Tarenaya hassleriana]|uniref:putative 1-phosphatidylinositol-3-phosphate 5-kinase FAB1C isoform X2 n=1 Tax=Tarenaya hassleriana TaxID=28532 RepID=UPI00053C3D64|nr:PREDICTED: putative 1-phosphatidylinositol-3-phosphate 5-kinase FAB1C isoform X2 [Tarenaya hassleriana]